MTSSKTLKPVDYNVQRGNTTPGTKMRKLEEELHTKAAENGTLRTNIDELTSVISKLNLIKESASVAPSVDTKKDKKAPVVPYKTAYKFFCEAQKKQGNMQEEWKNCSPEIREKYQQLSLADKGRYYSEMDAYNEEQRALEMYYEKKKQEQAMAFYEAHLQAQAVAEDVQEGMAKKKKKKAPKDPDAPKRCMSSYMYFAQAKRAAVAEKNKEAKVTEISKILGEMWKAATDKEKKPFEEMAAEDKERYTKEKAAYDAKLAERKEEEEREAAARFEQDKKEAMEYMESQSVQPKQVFTGEEASVMSELTGTKPQKKKKDPNAPKRALTAYNFFVQEKRNDIKGMMPDNATHTELMTEIGQQWKKLSTRMKGKYDKLAAKDKERYAKEMEEYTASQK